MTFIDILLVLLCMAGITFIFVHSTIMDKIGLRKLWEKWDFTKELFHCSMCCPFWFSIYGMAAIYVKFTYAPIFFYMMVLPFASSAFCYFFERMAILFDEMVVERENKRKNKLKFK